MNGTAKSVIRKMGIECKVFAETKVSHEWMAAMAGVMSQRATEELSYRIGIEIAKANKLAISSRAEEKIHKNVPERTGNEIMRATAIVFNPVEFEDFLFAYAQAVISKYENGEVI